MGDYHYRPIAPGEEEAVCTLIAHIFEAFVAPHYVEEGVEEFNTYIDPDTLCERLEGDHRMLVATEGESDEIVGVLEIREHQHISLLFVDADHQRQGVGRALLARGVALCRAHDIMLEEITVNASPNAVDAYKRFGFQPQGPEQLKNGIRYQPMTLKLR
jgi:GNAT superfamily N-acetyltransferase